MSRNNTPERPRQGGSFVRQPNGKLKRTQFTRPSNGPDTAAEAAEPAPAPAQAPAPTEQEK